jgi:Ca2+-binding RTX toxin-like protein
MGVYNGNKRNDNITGSAKDDFINGKEGDDHLWGRGGNDEIHGWYGNDFLYGEAGNDRLFGEDGNDFLDGGDGDDLLNGGAGTDSLYGRVGNDRLYGGDGNDIVDAGDGDDEVAGDRGTDSMTGGSGADHFYFNDLTASNAVYGIDTVMDFNPAEGDQLWLGPVDANASLSGAQRWDYSASAPVAPLTGGNGQATVSYDGTYTTVTFYNVDGDTNPDFIVKLAGSVVDPQFYAYVDGTPNGGFSDPAIIYPGP